MTGYLRLVACTVVGVAIGMAVSSPPNDAGHASYAAEHASECERDSGHPEMVVAQNPGSERDQLYSAVTCAGYQAGRLDAATGR